MLSSTETHRGKLLSQYVLARIIRMDGVDIGLYDYDRYNTLYYFIINADERIYLRYGGRDAWSPKTYLNLSSIEVALEQGLELHRRNQRGELAAAKRPKPLFPRQIPALFKQTIDRGRCVECHLIGDLQNVQREKDGTLDKLKHMYRSPDIKVLGIQLDIPKGLVVKEARGAVQSAGMKPGDRITHFNKTPVWTFGDLQYKYDNVGRGDRSVQITVSRHGEPIDLEVSLPRYWWMTNLRYRQWSVDPRTFFESRPLSDSEKREHGLAPDGFAGEVTKIDSVAQLLRAHELKQGDIVFGVGGVERDDIANTPELFIKLRTKAGDTVMLNLIRGGERMTMPLKTVRISFRK